jgi:hypothetical protein
MPGDKKYINEETELDLRCCNIGHEHARVLANELAVNVTLRRRVQDSVFRF